eukprot:5465619-Amphidinium_carterae.1
MEVTWFGTPGFFHGDVYTDGSATHPRSPHGRRAGWSVVMLGDSGEVIRAVYGPLPQDVSPDQTVRCAEDYAVHKALLHGCGDMHLHVDCAGTVRAAVKAGSG